MEEEKPEKAEKPAEAKEGVLDDYTFEREVLSRFIHRSRQKLTGDGLT